MPLGPAGKNLVQIFRCGAEFFLEKTLGTNYAN